MSKLKDLTGQRFGRLTVIERAENKGKHTAWKCQCDCGNITVAVSYNLRKGFTKSCGCIGKEHPAHFIHGMHNTKVHKAWIKMRERCFSQNSINYKNYGGRGITMYPAWVDDFQAFYDYVRKLEHFDEKGYSIDRIDVNGNYEPNNLRWADTKTQARNKRNNHLVEYKGAKMSLAEAAEKSGINYGTLISRLKRGDTGDYLFRPVKPSISRKSS